MTLGNASPRPRPDGDRPPLPEGWVWTTLEEVADTTRKRMNPQEQPHLRFIGMEHIEAHTMKLLGTVFAGEMKSTSEYFEPGDVLYGRLRPYLNKVYRPDFEGLCSAEFIVFRQVPHLNGKYLQFFLNSWDFVSFASHLNEGDRPRVNFDQLASYPFPLAPLPEQHRIVAAIETQFTRLDAAVAALERAKANLARYKASVLKAACEGRLVPTDAALYHARCDCGGCGGDRRGEAAPDSGHKDTLHDTAEAPRRDDIAVGLPRPSISTDAGMNDAYMHDACRGEATPKASIYAQMREDAKTHGQEEPGGGCLAPTDAGAGDDANAATRIPVTDTGGIVDAQMRDNACKGEATLQTPTNAKMRGDAQTLGHTEPGGGSLAPATVSHIDGKGEATPQASTNAKMRGDAKTPGQEEPGGGCLAPSTTSHIGGKGEATPQSPMTAMGNGDTETPGQAEPGGGCLAPTDTGIGDDADADAAYEPADVLLRRILAERRARWMADHPGKRYVEPQGPDTSGLPELPEGWVWATVEQLVDVGTGATPLRSKRAAYYENGTVPWVTSGALNDLFIDNATEFVTELALQETNAKLFPSGSLLVAMYGEGKTRGKVSELRLDAATNQACAALLFGGEAQDCKPFVKIFFRKNYDDIRRLSSGGVQPNLNLSIIRETLIPLPPLAEQHRIVAEVERRLSVVAEVEAAIDANLARAARLRQAILREAFAGRLVPRGDEDVGGVASPLQQRDTRNMHKQYNNGGTP